MSLRYPSKFDANMPFILFTAYEYLCPRPSIKVADTGKNKIPRGIQVALYMPGDFTETIASDWSPEEIYAGGTGQGLPAEIVANAGKAFGNVDNGKLMGSVTAWAGKLPFPSDVNVFKGMQPMSFNLSFNMIPYNKSEADSIVDICKTFKQNMLPTAVTNEILSFPCIWDLTFQNIKGVGINKELTYELMVMNNCTVNYISGQEGASVYKDNNPTQIRLTLQFTALRKMFFGGK